MGTGYTKLFSDIVESSIWDENSDTCKVWITLLAKVDGDGFVHGSVGWLAKISRVSIPTCEAALKKFLAPDPYSKTPDNEGRRISITGDGWFVLNHSKYRNMDGRELSKDARKTYKREWMRSKRAVEGCPQEYTGVHKSTLSASASVSVQGTGGAGEEGSTSITLPESLNTPEFVSVWYEWKEYRKKKKACKDFTALFRRQLEFLKPFGAEGAIESMKASMLNDWQGLFEPKPKTLNATHQGNHPRRINRNEGSYNEGKGASYAALVKRQNEKYREEAQKRIELEAQGKSQKLSDPQ